MTFNDILEVTKKHERICAVVEMYNTKFESTHFVEYFQQHCPELRQKEVKSIYSGQHADGISMLRVFLE